MEFSFGQPDATLMSSKMTVIDAVMHYTWPISLLMMQPVCLPDDFAFSFYCYCLLRRHDVLKFGCLASTSPSWLN